MDRQAADTLVGTTVGQYDVLARIGGGGMGVVYSARDTRLGRLVALKFLPREWSHDESAKQRFIREAQAASATDHPNICTIHDIGSTPDGQLYIVMAQYEGQTLKQKLEQGRLPVEETIDIAAQVAEGLAKAHAQGVVHRDIKPGNLMVTPDGIRILDFGLAKLADSQHLTIMGSTVGTVAYMSPEQIRGEDVGPATDIWAIGVVLYQMLSGGLPFKGGYPEAIAHAIKNDPPPPLRGFGEAGPAPLRGPGSDIPEELEQIVFRALHKDPRIRFQTARDLARALRRLQGRTLPLDLRTEPLPPLTTTASPTRRIRWWQTRAGLGAAAVLVVALLGTPFWLFSPVERVPVVIAPVVNQTGYAELDSYRLALTEELIGELADSAAVRVMPYDRELQIIRRFRAAGQDISSREVIQALTANSGAQVVVVPTLLYENGAWRARVEFRRADTGTNDATAEMPPVVSSLIKDTAYGFMPPLASSIQAYFIETGPRRAYVADIIRKFVGRERPSPALRLRTLDAAAAFEAGIDAYEQQEYSTALRAFTDATSREPRNPLLFAWRSRVAWLMRQDKEAGEAADQASRLLSPETPADTALFVQAAAAEARREFTIAEARYRELVARHPDDPAWLIELAAFQDRQLRTADAVASYHRALALDARLVRPHLELCRLYGPNRLNDPPNAKEQGRLALAGYRALAARAGEGQTLWCLTDVLRVGSDNDRREARLDAEAALGIFKDLQYSYNVSRAVYYVGLAAAAQGNLPEAAALWEQALMSTRAAGNALLEPLVLMNLGVMHNALGNRARAAEYYSDSATLYEALGDEQRAAQIQANRAALLIDYGPDPDEGLRDLRNALEVFRKLGDRNFEVFAAQVTAAYYRYSGRHAGAERELNRALALARERNLEDDIASLTMDIARSRLETGDYTSAKTLLEQAVGDGSGPKSTEARIYLARVNTRLGDFAGAGRGLMTASQELTDQGDNLLPLLHLALGELAYESDRPAARMHFAAAAEFWKDATPDAASVEATAYLGLLDGLDGQYERGITQVRRSLEQAQKMGRFSLEVLCRLFLARLAERAGRADEALALLRDLPPDGEQAIGPELQAQIHYWRGRAHARRGDAAAARLELETARRLIEQVRTALPETYRNPFASRPDIHILLS